VRMIADAASRFCGSSAGRGPGGSACLVSLEGDRRGDTWEIVLEADVPRVGIYGHLEYIWER
jgi:hypothetical protein